MGSSHDEEAFAAGLSRLHRTRVVLAHRHRTSASYHDLCAGASATRHALPGGSPRAVKALRLAAHSAATRRRADASRRSRVGRQRVLMESRQILAFALHFIDDWRAGAADRVRECRHSAAGARGGAAEGNCRPDIDRCGTLAPLPPTAHRKRTAIRRCGRVERRGCDLGQPHAGGIRFGRRNSEAEPCTRLAHVRVCRSEEHTSELQSQSNLVCRLLLEKKKKLSITEDTYHHRPAIV